MPKRVEVFWIPPQIETYMPVTAENIEQMAFKVVLVKNERQADLVLSLVQKTKKELDPKKIRIKISVEHKSFNFDSNGTGVSSTGEAFQIDIQKLKQVLCD